MSWETQNSSCGINKFVHGTIQADSGVFFSFTSAKPSLGKPVEPSRRNVEKSTLIYKEWVSQKKERKKEINCQR